MARVTMPADTLQVFRGGLNKLSLWAQHIGGACCDPAVTPVIDRLNPTINPENANIHTNPFGHRDYWHFGTLADSERQRIIDFINTEGVGAKLEVMVLPTFSLLNVVRVDILAEETGLAFTLSTRNGTVLPTGQLIEVAETDSGDGCGEVARVQTVMTDYTGLGPLGGATRVYHMGVSDQGGEFVLEADVLVLEVTAVPAGGVKGYFDMQVHATYTAPGRSEAPR
jgi:hypothetical protein